MMCVISASKLVCCRENRLALIVSLSISILQASKNSRENIVFVFEHVGGAFSHLAAKGIIF